jgi:hypothetical protein
MQERQNFQERTCSTPTAHAAEQHPCCTRRLVALLPVLLLSLSVLHSVRFRKAKVQAVVLKATVSASHAPSVVSAQGAGAAAAAAGVATGQHRQCARWQWGVAPMLLQQHNAGHVSVLLWGSPRRTSLLYSLFGVGHAPSSPTTAGSRAARLDARSSSRRTAS